MLQGHPGQRGIAAITGADDANAFGIDKALMHQFGQPVGNVGLHLAPPFTITGVLERRTIAGGPAKIGLKHGIAA